MPVDGRRHAPEEDGGGKERRKKTEYARDKGMRERLPMKEEKDHEKDLQKGWKNEEMRRKVYEVVCAAYQQCLDFAAKAAKGFRRMIWERRLLRRKKRGGGCREYEGGDEGACGVEAVGMVNWEKKKRAKSKRKKKKKKKRKKKKNVDGAFPNNGGRDSRDFPQPSISHQRGTAPAGTISKHPTDLPACVLVVSICERRENWRRKSPIAVCGCQSPPELSCAAAGPPSPRAAAALNYPGGVAPRRVASLLPRCHVRRGHFFLRRRAGARAEHGSSGGGERVVARERTLVCLLGVIGYLVSTDTRFTPDSQVSYEGQRFERNTKADR
ncbi:Protein of unknown function [Gryllus bimaculatus]|nr:Protein of unknown function [Gryllus bimaculatus]